MAKRKAGRVSARKPKRSDKQQLEDLYVQVKELEARVQLAEDYSPQRVFEERERLELSAADYSELVGVAPITVYNWEHGRSTPRKAQLESLRDVFGIGKEAAWKRLGY